MAAPETVGHYRILGPLGRGGMGVVFRAEDTRLGRVVALKFLPAEWTADAEKRERFVREARAASALDHPNVCTVHEIGETGSGDLYIAMACYEGETLRRRLAASWTAPAKRRFSRTRLVFELRVLVGLGAIHADLIGRPAATHQQLPLPRAAGLPQNFARAPRRLRRSRCRADQWVLRAARGAH